MRCNEFDQPIGDSVDGWLPRPAPAPVTLMGQYARLEPLSQAHRGAVAELGAIPQLWTYRPDGPLAPDEVGEWIERRVAETATVTFAVVRLGLGVGGDEEAVQGMCSLMRTDATGGVTEIGAILYSPDLQGTAASTEVTHVVARHVFDDLGYRRLEWKCDSLNEPSRRAAARLGFTYEGRFRQHLVYRGRNRDTDWFSIIDAEWPAIRAEHERWLDPSNFDADGRQLTKLMVRQPTDLT